MASGFNKCIMIGNLVADPELKSTQSGVFVCTFRIAVGRRFAKPGDDVKTDFFDVTAWRQQGEFVSKYFRKGDPILVCGQMQCRAWTDKDGNKRNSYELVADEVSFVGSKSENGQGNASNGNAGGIPQYNNPSSSGFQTIPGDDELPF